MSDLHERDFVFSHLGNFLFFGGGEVVSQKNKNGRPIALKMNQHGHNMFKLTLIQSQSDRTTNIKVLVFRDTNIWSTKLTRGSTSALKTPYFPLPYLEPTLPFF